MHRVAKGGGYVIDHKFPKGEDPVVWLHVRGTPYFVITENKIKNTYFLYEIVDGTIHRLGRSDSPKKLEEIFSIKEKLESVK